MSAVVVGVRDPGAGVLLTKRQLFGFSGTILAGVVIGVMGGIWTMGNFAFDAKMRATATDIVERHNGDQAAHAVVVARVQGDYVSSDAKIAEAITKFSDAMASIDRRLAKIEGYLEARDGTKGAK
jgi:hypothetical protein